MAIPKRRVNASNSDVITTFDEADKDIDSNVDEESKVTETTNEETKVIAETPIVETSKPTTIPTPPKVKPSKAKSVELTKVNALVTKYLFSGGKGYSLIKGQTVSVPTSVVSYWRSLRLIK